MKRHWKVRDSQSVLSVPARFDVLREVVELPDGRIINDYYRIEFLPAVIVVAEVENDTFLCLEHYRHGLGRVTLGLPGGGIRDGEDPLESAKRELLEESGFFAEQYIKLGSFHTAANRGGAHCTIFYAQQARKVANPQPIDLEDVEVRLMSRLALLESIKKGHFGCSTDLAAITLFLAWQC